jgi:group I intron endonuclease
MKNLLKKFGIEPIKIYLNALECKSELKILKNKSGIYMWYNNITNEYYIGSSINLYNRLNKYYSNYHLSFKNQIIINSLLKYNHSNFSLIILELISNKKDILLREQYYLNLLIPQLNILKLAGNTLGYKHNEISKLKISKLKKGTILNEKTKLKISQSLKGRTLNEESKNRMILSLKGRTLDEKTKLKISKSIKGESKIYCYDNNNNLIKIYNSPKEIALEYDLHPSTIRKYILTEKLFKNKYYFKRIISN